jgi:regulator of replication initiation timing
MTPIKLSEVENRANAMLMEVCAQRSAMGDRAAILASENSMLKAEIETLKERISELEKPK